MIKFVISAFIFVLGLCSIAVSQQQQAPLNINQCQVHSPWGVPQVTKVDANLICRRGYLLLHDNQAKIPTWVSWMVNPNTVNGCMPRNDAFQADLSLSANKRALPADYVNSGYDKGHLANTVHQSVDAQLVFESFYMSNMSPQLPGMNRGLWKLLETATGSWVYSRQAQVIVYAGNIYDVNNSKKIGKGQVVVPAALFKIVIDQRSGDHLAFLFPNQENLGNDLRTVQTTIAEIERYTGIVFPIPVNKTAKNSLWRVDFKAITEAKRTACRK